MNRVVSVFMSVIWPKKKKKKKAANDGRYKCREPNPYSKGIYQICLLISEWLEGRH